MQIKLLPENERPIEKVIKFGVDTLSNSELLALIIHTGTREHSAIHLAEEIMSIFPSGICGLSECTLEDLLNVSGIGKSKACSILASVELSKRISISKVMDRAIIESSKDVAELFMEDLRHEKKEHFKSVLVNSKGGIIAVDNVSVGELSSTVVHPREVFSQAVKKSAAGVIFVHNHPSGDPMPSQEDIDTTVRLVECGQVLGIRVLDHIIIGDGKFESLMAMKLLE